MRVSPTPPGTLAALPPDGGCPTGRRRAPGRDGPAHRPDGLARPSATGSTPVGAVGKVGCASRIASQVGLSPYLTKRMLRVRERRVGEHDAKEIEST